MHSSICLRQSLKKAFEYLDINFERDYEEDHNYMKASQKTKKSNVIHSIILRVRILVSR